MFFNGENPVISVIGVEHMQWKSGSFDINPRIFSALAFRIKGDAEITVKDTKYIAGPNSVLYLPQNFVNAVCEIMSSFKNSDISVSLVCKNAGICETSFRELFKKYYIKTPIEFITDLRIENAKGLISNGLSVEAAAYESGFNDPKYFAQIVKKKLGCTPSELKQLVK